MVQGRLGNNTPGTEAADRNTIEIIRKELLGSLTNDPNHLGRIEGNAVGPVRNATLNTPIHKFAGTPDPHSITMLGQIHQKTLPARGWGVVKKTLDTNG
jgi:hypothetical protein